MAVRFDAASDRVSYTASAPPVTFTITFWAHNSVDQNTNATFARLHASSGGSTAATFATDSDGTSGPGYFTAGGSIVQATGCPVGVWRKIAYSRTGSSGGAYVAAVGGVTEVDTGTVGTVTPDGITLGGRSSGDATEWFNGRLAYVRVWSAVLSQSEIEAEWASTTPVRTSGLWAHWPLSVHTDLTDHSGNGRNLVAGTTATTTEAGPPLASLVTGTAVATLGGLTATAAGVRQVIGNANTTLAGPTLTAVGLRTVVGAAATALPALTASAVGLRAVTGTGTAALGGLVAHAVTALERFAVTSDPPLVDAFYTSTAAWVDTLYTADPPAAT